MITIHLSSHGKFFLFLLPSPPTAQTLATTTVSSPDPQPSDSPSTTDSKTLGSHSLGEASDHPERNGEGGAEEKDEEEEEEEEEEERECGFCLFMKGGGCRDEFVAWEACVQDSEKNEEDVVDKCFGATAALRNCMEAHSGYYEPILRTEKAAEEEVAKELEEEEEKKSGRILLPDLTILRRGLGVPRIRASEMGWERDDGASDTPRTSLIGEFDGEELEGMKIKDDCSCLVGSWNEIFHA